MRKIPDEILDMLENGPSVRMEVDETTGVRKLTLPDGETATLPPMWKVEMEERKKKMRRH